MANGISPVKRKNTRSNNHAGQPTKIFGGLYSGKPRPLSYKYKDSDQRNGEVKIIVPRNK